jgi:gamma-glutamylcyclotransferase
MILYFAYGSNLCESRMKQRCSSARFRCRALLKHHGLAITRTSKNGGGTADVVPLFGDDVWGVVYEIDDSELQQLDSAEGYYPGRLGTCSYIRFGGACVLEEGDEQCPLVATIYLAVKQPGVHRPTAQYKGFITCGARTWKLPDAYITKLEAIKVSP